MAESARAAALVCGVVIGGVLVLGACGQHEPKAIVARAQANLDAGDACAALAAFERALAALPPDDPARRAASLGRCRALERIDASAARRALAEHASAFPGTVDAIQVEEFAFRLLASGHPRAAFDVLHDAHAHFPRERLQPAVKRFADACRERRVDPRVLGLGCGY